MKTRGKGREGMNRWLGKEGHHDRREESERKGGGSGGKNQLGI